MNKKNKFIALAIGLMPILVLGVAFSIPRPSETKAAASETIIYDYYSKTDSGLSSAVPQIANWVTSDSNGSNQTFTFNVGGYNATTPYTYLGGTAGTVLTGTLPGQFVYGNPTLKALANKTNITNFKKLYGFRMNSDVDLTNFLNISVTISWEAGGVGSYTGFIA
jgi:hypothetical protein